MVWQHENLIIQENCHLESCHPVIFAFKHHILAKHKDKDKDWDVRLVVCDLRLFFFFLRSGASLNTSPFAIVIEMLHDQVYRTLLIECWQTVCS